MNEQHPLPVESPQGDEPPECPEGGAMRYVEDEYGSLAEGGSYEIWECSVHGTVRLQLPD